MNQMTQSAQAGRNKLVAMAAMAVIAVIAIMPSFAHAATTGVEFQGVYDFVYNAATGYLGRAIAIIGGLIGMGYGAASGKVLPAVVGVMLAIFGALGPTIINSIFSGALI